ncbi:MAG TPA: hypothetical protein VHW66_07125 [Stellaceae bacterium]|nr:hypothetical protein [Stellaceae bacterium]
MTAGLAIANPQGGKVNIGAGGSKLTVTQTSNRAIINWNSFSTAKGETAKFVLPSSTAAVLNRVTGGQLSSLLAIGTPMGKSTC